ncbi:MAG: Sec-independent protein translocase subunit TatB [Rhodococcus sp.]|nr:Sec-independent protein translocase subunit TatB [Rhodococcus sp. (in: high G+C Gram-positive bacteria)]
MFGNVGWGEFVVILIAALVILGPERLPGAISWVSKSLRQVRNYASGATQQLKDELGPEFDDLRKPLSELNQLRGMSPRAAITKHLLDGDGSLFSSIDNARNDLNNGLSLNNVTSGTSAAGAATGGAVASSSPGAGAAGGAAAADKRPPIDTDAT